MGTETFSHASSVLIMIEYVVKLNNPPMGTETYHTSSVEHQEEIRTVKLNNPPMGTETFTALFVSLLWWRFTG